MFKKHPRIPLLEIHPDGTIRHSRTQRVKKDRDVTYHLGNTYSTALLVAQTFLPNPEGFRRAERIRLDRRPSISNVRWCKRTRAQVKKQPYAPHNLGPRERPVPKDDPQNGRAVSDGTRTYPSVSIAAYRHGIGRTTISRAISSGKPHKGVHWRYVQEGEELL